MLAHCTAVSKDNQVEYWQTEKNILLQILVFIMNAYYVSGLVLITSYTVYTLLNPSKNYELEILIILRHLNQELNLVLSPKSLCFQLHHTIEPSHKVGI